MTEVDVEDGDEISLLGLAATLLRNRWRIVRWALVGAIVAALTVFSKPALYVASASFIPSGADAGGRSGLASLAGQLGVAVSTGDPSQSPEFYSKLLKSRVLLRDITRDTFAVAELGGKRLTFDDLFEIPAGTVERRDELALNKAQAIVDVTTAKPTGVIELTVATRWRSVSLAIASQLVSGIDQYNQRTRQSQAAAERKFVEGRQAVASADLRAAEDRLENFLIENRQIGGSPELTFQRDRLQRDVSLRQQLYTSLSQSLEEARIREVRDTPAITLFEPPVVPTLPSPRGRATSVLVGMIVGAIIGALLTLISAMMRRRRREGDVNAEAFAGAVGEMLRPVRRIAQRTRG